MKAYNYVYPRGKKIRGFDGKQVVVNNDLYKNEKGYIKSVYDHSKNGGNINFNIKLLKDDWTCTDCTENQITILN
jgi:hypothetical protein